MILSLSSFDGLRPSLTDSTLPTESASSALNVDLRHGFITPLLASSNVYTNLPSGIKYVSSFDNLHFLTSTEFLQAYLSPTTQDIYGRIYYTEGNKIRVTTQGALSPNGGPPSFSYIPGVPTPDAAPSVELVRKNRWPSYPDAVLKGKFFLESEGQRYNTTDITLTQKPGSLPFSAYIFDSGINVKDLKAIAQSETDKMSYFSVNDIFYAKAIYVTSNFFYLGYYFVANEWSIIDGLCQRGDDYVTLRVDEDTINIPLDIVKFVKDTNGLIKYIQSSDNDNTKVSSDAVPALELWLQVSEDSEERIWTAFVNTTTPGIVSTVPGGITISLAPVDDTKYELNFTYGVIEDRAYVYTLINEWNEESAPSPPVNTSVTYLDDVILRVDIDACVSLFKDKYGDLIYCPYKTIQFYCAARTGTYQAIATSPTGVVSKNSISITDLYHSILGRDPDSEGLTYWTALYNSGMDISEIARRMYESNEYRHYESGFYIEDLYEKLFSREPDNIGYMYHITRYESGVDLREIIVDFISGQEFANKHPSLVNNTTITFIEYVYDVFLDRLPDQYAVDFWLSRVNFGWVDWASHIIAVVLTSEEYKAKRRRVWVTSLLGIAYGREPTTSEIDEAVDKLASGYSLASLLMKESSVTSDGFLDEGKRAGWELQTGDWNPPPPDLENLTLLPNGVFAASKNTEVWFSEPYLPFTWPKKYIQNTSYKVIALAPYGGNLLVVTSDKPIVVTGPHPGGMTQIGINYTAPGISQKALALVNGNPVYATKNGLFFVDGTSGTLELSKRFWSISKWEELYGDRLDSLSLKTHDGKLIGLFTNGDGFIVEFSSNTPKLVDFSLNGYSFFTVPLLTDLFIVTSDGCKKLFNGDVLPAKWKSKLFVLQKPPTLGAACLLYRGNFELKVFTETGLKFTKEFTSSDNTLKKSIFRLPAGEKPSTFMFEVLSDSWFVVERIDFSSVVLELANV